MAHFAELSRDNIVLRVIVVDNEDILDANGNESEQVGVSFCQSLFGSDTHWAQTSYHGNFRARYAGIGYTFDASRDAFISPQPYPSWALDDETTEWVAPVPYPSDGGVYAWDEETQAWVAAHSE